jgi:hypothetical protein
VYVEQKLVRCEACGRAFAVRYAVPPGAAPAAATSPLLEWRGVACPHESCSHVLGLPLPCWARHLDAHVLPLGTPGRAIRALRPPRALAS